MTFSIHYLDWGVILIYFLLLIGIGLFRSRESRKTQEEYILAGRRLSLPGFIATLVATWYGGILGVGENTFNFGIQTWFIFGLPYYFFAIFFGVWLAPKIRKKAQLSIPDHFANHYGKNSGIISALILLIIATPAPYILSIGILLQFIFGIPFGWAIIIATVLSLFYIWFGGFGAVIRTDIFQFLLMFTGFILLVVFAWLKIGPIGSVVNQLPSSHLEPLGGNSFQYVMAWFFIALWTFVDPGFYQRCAAAKSPRIARNGILISVGFWFLFDILTLFSGLYARSVLTGGDALFAYPALGQKLLPPIVYGIFLTGILATIMSTIDSFGLVSAVTFGRDILWRIQTPPSKIAANWEYESTSYIQKGLVVMAFIALLLAFSIPSVVRLWYLVGSIIVPGLLIPFLLTFSKYSLSDSRAIIFIILPVIVAGIWFLVGKFTSGYPLGMEPFYPGLLTSIFLLTGARRK